MIALSGCGKYDDGPKFSPWPKKWRIDKTWKLDETVTGSVTISSSSSDTYQYKGNGDYIETSGSASLSGKWEWGDKKESVKITIGSITTEQKILRLTTKELWLEGMSGSTEFHYIKN